MKMPRCEHHQMVMPTITRAPEAKGDGYTAEDDEEDEIVLKPPVSKARRFIDLSRPSVSPPAIPSRRKLGNYKTIREAYFS